MKISVCVYWETCVPEVISVRSIHNQLGSNYVVHCSAQRLHFCICLHVLNHQGWFGLILTALPVVTRMQPRFLSPQKTSCQA
jgi:hypothetical protein